MAAMPVETEVKPEKVPHAFFPSMK